MTERIVASGDVRLWAEGLGQHEEPAILLVAGANASSRMWPDSFVSDLAGAGFRVVRYDHRDTGRSSQVDFDAAPYSVADLAADAVAVLDGLGIARAHVVGLSMGGSIGQLLALDRPERLRSLTLMLTTALDVDFADAYRRALSGEASGGSLPTPRPDVVARLAGMFNPGDTRERELERRIEQWRVLCGDVLPFDPQEFRALEAASIDHAGTISPPAAHARAAPPPTARGCELSRVRVPTLVIQGELDPLNPPPHGARLAQMIPGATYLEIPGMGHALPARLHGQIVEAIVRHARRADGLEAASTALKPAGTAHF